MLLLPWEIQKRLSCFLERKVEESDSMKKTGESFRVYKDNGNGLIFKRGTLLTVKKLKRKRKKGYCVAERERERFIGDQTKLMEIGVEGRRQAFGLVGRWWSVENGNTEGQPESFGTWTKHRAH